MSQGLITEQHWSQSRSVAYGRIDDNRGRASERHHSRQHSWLQNVYARVSGSDRDDHLDDAQYLQDVKYSSPVKESLTPLVFEVISYDYEDPPPPSAIRTYRENRELKKARSGSKIPPVLPSNPPLLSAFTSPDPFDHSIAVSGPPANSLANMRLQPIDTPPSRSTTIPSPPAPSPTNDSTRSDSFLARAFSNGLESASSFGGSSVGHTSSQLHRTDMRTAAMPNPVVVSMGAARFPAVVEHDTEILWPPESLMSRATAGQEAQRHPTRPSSSRLPQIRSSTSPSLQRNSRTVSRDAFPYRNRFVPRRDQIVLPAPLAPAAGLSNIRRFSEPSVTELLSPLSESLLLSASPTDGEPSPSAVSPALRRSALGTLQRHSYAQGNVANLPSDDLMRPQTSRQRSTPPEMTFEARYASAPAFADSWLGSRRS